MDLLIGEDLTELKPSPGSIWIRRVYIIFGIFFMMFLCLCHGVEFEQNMRQRDENMQTVTWIAVVNMNTGIVRDGELLNYAA